MKTNVTYRFEIRVDGYLIGMTESEPNAILQGFDTAEFSKVVTIIDNDAKAPVKYRIAAGMIEVLQ
jgi:hypothetical protein